MLMESVFFALPEVKNSNDILALERFAAKIITGLLAAKLIY